MNTSILQKCVVELKKDNPKIDYILGMLETVIEMSNVPPTSVVTSQWTPAVIESTYTQTASTPVVGLSDEEKLAEEYERGPIGGLQ